eukprot:6818698-Pyramimonas_sp.AAC.1
MHRPRETERFRGCLALRPGSLISFHLHMLHWHVILRVPSSRCRVHSRCAREWGHWLARSG